MRPRVRYGLARAQATALFNLGKRRWFTSYLVVSECYSWFLHRHGEEAARVLDRFRGTKLTYVDASSLCLMERHKIRRVSSTDHHLAMTGAEVLPRA